MSSEIALFSSTNRGSRGRILCPRLPLGEDAVTAMEEKLQAVQKDIDDWREVAIDTKVDEEQGEAAGN